MLTNDKLVQLVQARQSKKSEPFWGGIQTADRFVKTLESCVGSDFCYRYAATRSKSFDDVIKKASRTLTYNNPDMTLEENVGTGVKIYDADGEQIELPKNSLMVFKHVLTTSKKDRDGDVMRTSGARPDPKMLLLWQHVHTLPIGKMLSVVEHTKNRMSVYSAVVDINDLAHDAAVMIDNDMGRFSHGFRALEFDDLKAERGSPTSPGGFDIKSFEIMEESLVSVPANPDSETEEVLISMTQRGKLTSPLMKQYGKSLDDRRTRKSYNVPVHLDLHVKLNGKSLEDEGNEEQDDEPTETKSGCGCGCGGSKPDECTCASEKANDRKEQAAETDDANEEMTCPKCHAKLDGKTCPKCGVVSKNTPTKVNPDGDGMPCPKCGGIVNDNRCQSCGYTMADPGGKAIWITQEQMKQICMKCAKNMQMKGLNKINLKALPDGVMQDLCQQFNGDDFAAACQGGLPADVVDDSKAFCNWLKSRCSQQKFLTTENRNVELSAKDAMAIFLAKSGPEEWDTMGDAIEALKGMHEQDIRTKQFQAVTGQDE